VENTGALQMVAGLQVLLPVPSCQKPVTHAAHVLWPAVAVNCPAAQLAHDWPGPAALKLPAAQAVQRPEPAPPQAVWYWPASQV
jgi:hypothetical protein